jgi:hypothetical protein
MLAHAQTIDAKQVNSQQFRASEGRAQSTYSMVGQRHHHCARAASVAGDSAGLWTVGEPAAARACVVSEAHAARPSDHVVLWRSGRLLGRQLRSGRGSLRGHHHRRASGRTARPPASGVRREDCRSEHKIKWDDGNPTGHGIIFIGMGGQVYCYVPPGGV